MVEEILNFKNTKYLEKDIENLKQKVIQSKNARYMFLYLYYVDTRDLNTISKYILETKDSRYIHFLLRSFHLEDYNDFMEYVLSEDHDARYLYNILYDVDDLDNEYRLKIIKRLISLKNRKYILEALYYYFVILNLYHEDLFSYTKELFEKEFSINMNDKNYHLVFEELFRKENNIATPSGFSHNYFQGRNGHIPNMIVCHINHTYASAISHFYKENQVSSHFLIRKDGYIKQVVSLDNSAWANGTSLKDSSDAYYKFSTSKIINCTLDNANYYTFSIEHESFDGTLTKEQFHSTIKVMKTIIKYVKDTYHYDCQMDRDHIIGHYEVNPIVKPKCPGNLFPFDKIIETLKKECRDD